MHEGTRKEMKMSFEQGLKDAFTRGLICERLKGKKK